MKSLLKYKKLIEQQGINSRLVNSIIEAHQKDRDRMLKLYERYKADPEGPKIFSRESIAYEEFETGGNVRRLDDKVNNQLNNAFDVDIVDTKVGYMFGHPISYNLNDDKQKELKKEIDNFLLRSNAEDADSEHGKMAAICGLSARLAYIDKEGFERVKNIDPWEAIFIGDDLHEPDYSLRYYKQDDDVFAEFYDDLYIHYFESTNGSDFNLKERKPHMFEYNPLFGVANNAELKGDAEKVLSLIDAYDRTISDASNEIEQYRLAYLILKGLGADEDTLKNLKKSGVFELFDKDDDVKYLTKDINDQMIENHLDRLEDNILRFAKSVNFTDESFAGQASGVAMKYKIMALENKCITMERKFTSALRYQFKVLFSAWSKRKGVSQEDYLNVWFGFKRNLPIHLTDEATATAQLKGNVSEKTRLALLPFVDDVQFEIDEMEKENAAYGEKLEPLMGKGTGLSETENASNDTDDDEFPCPECNGDGKISSPSTAKQIQCPSCKGTGVRQR